MGWPRIFVDQSTSLCCSRNGSSRKVRPMVQADLANVFALFQKFLERFFVAPVMSPEELWHRYSPRHGQRSYVIVDDPSGTGASSASARIEGFFCFTTNQDQKGLRVCMLQVYASTTLTASQVVG